MKLCCIDWKLVAVWREEFTDANNDGINDKYQTEVVFELPSENFGSLVGETTQWVTLRNEYGQLATYQHIKDIPISGLEPPDVIPPDGYVFKGWYPSLSDNLLFEGKTTFTFWAVFEEET